MSVAFDCLIENMRRHVVEAGKVGVQDYAVIADAEDAAVDRVGRGEHGGQLGERLQTAAASARDVEAGSAWNPKQRWIQAKRFNTEGVEVRHQTSMSAARSFSALIVFGKQRWRPEIVCR